MSMTEQAVTVAQEAMYVIRKGGYFYRPNAQGYTSSEAEAGRYTLAEAIAHSQPNGPDGPRDGMDYMLADGPGVPREPTDTRLASVTSASAEPFLVQLRRVNSDRYEAWITNPIMLCEHCGADASARSPVCKPPFDNQPHSFKRPHPYLTTRNDAGIMFDALELGGEVGELLNIVKKLEREERGWRGSRANPADFADECADVLICLDKLARRRNVDLAAATIAKFNATSDKVGLPHRLAASPEPVPATNQAGEDSARGKAVAAMRAYIASAGVPLTEFDPEFAVRMMGAMMVSFHKYGRVADAYPLKFDAASDVRARMAKYRETGNRHYLVDAANFAMIEAMHSGRKGGSQWGTNDAADSPGRTTASGHRLVQETNDGARIMGETILHVPGDEA